MAYAGRFRQLNKQAAGERAVVRSKSGLMPLPSALTRIIAVITLACFVTSFVGEQAVAAVVDMARETRQPSISTDDLAIPPTAGRITGARYCGSPTVVINIQDLHCHPQVQNNIAKILSLLDGKYALRNVYMEGAFGQVDTSWLSSIPDKAVRQSALKTLLAEGKLTGAEYYSVSAGRPDLIVGLEDRDMYRANALRLARLLENKAAIDTLLAGIEKDVRKLKEDYYNDKQARLESLVQRYDSGKLDARKFYRKLKRYADKLGVDFYGYRNIAGYLASRDIENEVNFHRVALELKEFILVLKQRLPYAAYNDLARETDNFAKTEALFTALPKLAAAHGVAFGAGYPELVKFFSFLNLNKKVNPLQLVYEEKKLVREMEQQFAEDDSQRETVFLADFVTYLQDYFHTSISADGYAYFRQNFEQFKLSWYRYIGNDRLQAIETYCTLLDEYYGVNIERNACFLKNLGVKMSGPADRNDASPYINDISKTVASLAKAKDIRVVVTGGFHTTGLTELLEHNNISYLVVTPNVTDDTRFSSQVYAKLAKEQAQILSQLFALVNISQHPYPERAVEIIRAFLNSGFTPEEAATKIQEYFDHHKAEGTVNFALGQTKDGRFPLFLRVVGVAGKETERRYNCQLREGKITIADEEADGGSVQGKDLVPVSPAKALRSLVSRAMRFLLNNAGLFIVTVVMVVNFVIGAPGQGIAASYDAGWQLPGTPFVRSYQVTNDTRVKPEVREYLKDFANTYDQALRVINLLKDGDTRTAYNILAYLRDQARNVDGMPTRSNKEWEVGTGEVVWAGIAAAHYAFSTGDSSFDDFLQRIDAYVLGRQAPEGYIMGGSKVTWSATEHNLDTLAYLTMRINMKGEAATQPLVRARMKVAAWLLSNYNRQEHRFNAGLNDPAFVTDTASWGVAVLDAVRLMDAAFYKASGLSGIDGAGLLDAAERRTRVDNVEYTLPGGKTGTLSHIFRFEHDAVSSEFSAQMALAYDLLGQKGPAKEIRDNLARIKVEGKLLYAPAPGGTIRNGEWGAFPYPSAAATEWYEFASRRMNPFLLGSAGGKGTVAPSIGQQQKEAGTVLSWTGNGYGGAQWVSVVAQLKAPVDFGGSDTLVMVFENAPQSNFEIQVKGADGRIFSGPTYQYKPGDNRTTFRFKVSDFPGSNGKISEIVIACGETVNGRKLNETNTPKQPFTIQQITIAHTKNVSLVNRLGMAAFSGVSAGLLSLSLMNPPVLALGAPVAGYYFLQAAYLVRAGWRRAPPDAAGFTEKLAHVISLARSGRLTAAWVENGEIRKDEEIFYDLPVWLQNIILAHEERHLAFGRDHPYLSLVPFAEEAAVSVLELVTLVNAGFRQLYSPKAVKAQAYLSAAEGEKRLLEVFSRNGGGYLAFSDVDKLKNMNALYSGRVVDYVIDHYLNLLHSAASRYGGYAMRFGGDEWFIYLPESVGDKGADILEEIRTSTIKSMDRQYGVARIPREKISDKIRDRISAYSSPTVDVKVVAELGTEYLVLFNLKNGEDLQGALEEINGVAGVDFSLDSEYNEGWFLHPTLSMGAIDVGKVAIDPGEKATQYFKRLRGYLGVSLAKAKETRNKLVFGTAELSSNHSGFTILKPGVSVQNLKPIASIPGQDAVRKEIGHIFREMPGELNVVTVLPSYEIAKSGIRGRGFKDINSEYGHLGGDEMIKLLYAVINEEVQRAFPGVVIARSPPDQFVISGIPLRSAADHKLLTGIFKSAADKINKDSEVRVQFDILNITGEDAAASFHGGPRIPAAAQIFERIDEVQKLLRSGGVGSELVQRMRVYDADDVSILCYDPKLQESLDELIRLHETGQRFTAYDSIMASRQQARRIQETVAAGVAQTFSPLNPLNAAGYTDIFTGKDQLSGRPIVLLSRMPSIDKLAGLSRQDVGAFGISVGMQGKHIFNVDIAVPGQQERAKIAVYLDHREGDVWNLGLFSDTLPAEDEASLLMLLGRGSLAVLRRLMSDRHLRERLRSLNFPIGEYFEPGIIEIEDSSAVLAHPEAVDDELTRFLPFIKTPFVYSVDDTETFRDGAVLSRIIAPAAFDRITRGGMIDLNRLGMLFADMVTGQQDAGSRYPELNGNFHVVPHGYMLTDEQIKGTLKTLYLPLLIDKQADGYTRPSANITQTLLVSMLPPSDNPENPDQGIGKLTGLPAYMHKEIKPFGADVVQLGPLTKPVADSPFIAASPYAGDDNLIDWLNIPEVKAMLGDGSITLGELAAGEDETEYVQRHNVSRRGLAVAGKVFARIAGEAGRAAGLKQFEEDNAVWLGRYANIMAAAVVLDVAADKIDDGVISAAREQNRPVFEETARIHRMMQWLFHGQLRGVLNTVHENGEKALFWIDVTDGNYAALEPVVRYWFARGFDGVRLNFLPDARTGEILDGAVLRRLKGVIAQCNPEAIVSVRPPREAAPAFAETAHRCGFYSIRMLSDLMGQKSVTGVDWVEVDAPDSRRPYLDSAYRKWFAGKETAVSTEYQRSSNFYLNLVRSAVFSGATYVSFMAGTLYGDRVPVREIDAGGNEHFNYRLPPAGSSRRVFDKIFERQIAALAVHLGHSTNPDDLYRAGFGMGTELMPSDVSAETMSALQEEEEIHFTGPAGEKRVVRAPGLNALVQAGAIVRMNDRAAEALTRTDGELFFVLLAGILQKTPGMRRDEWPTGWQYILKLQRQLRLTNDDREVRGYVLQLFGFVRAVNERLAEKGYRDAGGMLPENPREAAIFRSLISVTGALGMDAFEMLRQERNGMGRVPQNRDTLFKADAQTAMLLDIARGGSRDINAEQVLKDVKGRLNGENVALVVLYARALLAVRDAEGKSIAVEKLELMETLNMVFESLLKNGVPDGLLSGPLAGEDAESKAWVISELLKLFDVFAERNLKALSDRTKDVYRLLNGEGIARMRGAG